MKTLLLLISSGAAFAQLSQPIKYITSDPTAGSNCTNGVSMQLNISTSPPHLWACSDNAWQQLSGALVTAGSLTFSAPIADLTCADQTLSFAGASTGAAVAPRIPTTLPAGTVHMAFISASNTLKLRVCNLSGAAVTPPVDTYGAAIISGLVSGTASLTFGGVGDATCSSLTFTLSGANIGDAVVPQWPAAFPNSFYGAMQVSAANTIKITVCNFTGTFSTVSALTYGASLLR